MTGLVPIGFKGGRDYIHLTDLFPAMAVETGAEYGRDLTFTFHSVITTKAVGIRLLDPGERLPEDTAARLSFIDDEDRTRIAVAIAAETDMDIPDRDYDEATIARNLVIQNRLAVHKKKTSCTFPELIVAMNKCLLDSLFPRGDEKWWAVRLHLTVPQAHWSEVALTCQTEKPSRLYNSTISVDSTPVGEISFVSRPV